MKTSLISLTVAFVCFPVFLHAEEPVKPYPLKTCAVSGEKLGGMGTPYVMVYKGQEVKFCCEMCKPDFDKDPAKFLKKIEESEKSKS